MKGFDVIKKKEIAKLLARKMETDSDIFNLVLDVYNQYQESERDGVDYIFDLNNKNDLITCIKGGLTASMIQALKNIIDKSNKHYTQYFYFGCNHPTPVPILFNYLKLNLYRYLDEVVDYMMAYPFEGACRKLYTILITNLIIED